MTIKEITNYLNIPASTFHEWNKEGHKKYELTLLLLALPLEQVKSILDKEKKEEKPKYSKGTRYITLDKSQFDSDLLWTTENKKRIKISTLISVYMNRSTQKNSDKLCKLFGYDRVKQTIEKNITDEHNHKEAVNQIEYYKMKKEDKLYTPTHEELDMLLKHPKQRVVDFYCEKYSKNKLLEKASKLKPKFPVYLEIKEMVDYYESEYLDDKRVKICS